MFQLLKGQLINSCFLYLFSLVNVWFFTYPIGIAGGPLLYSTFTGSIARGFFAWGETDLLFFSDALALIAMSGFVTCFLSWLIWRKGGVLKTRRNYIFLTVVAVAWVAITPVLRNVLNLDQIFLTDLNANNYLPAFLLKFIVGPSESTFPNVAFAIFGQVFGIAIALGTPYKPIRNYGYTFGVIFTGIGITDLIVYGWTISPASIGNTLPFQNQLLNLGILLLLATFLIGYMEYQPSARREKIAKQTVIWRRYGLVALSIFILEGLLSETLKKIYMALLPNVNFTVINVPAALGYLIILLALWYLIIRVWEKFEFKGSFEWILVQVVGRLRGRMSNRLNVKEVLYNVEPAVVEENAVEAKE
jgi:hypothetical protein